MKVRIALVLGVLKHGIGMGVLTFRTKCDLRITVACNKPADW